MAAAAQQQQEADHPDLACPICMRGFSATDRIPIDLGCGHVFCDPCVATSAASFRRCPECRAPAQNPHTCYVLTRLLSSLPTALTPQPLPAASAADPAHVIPLVPPRATTAAATAEAPQTQQPGAPASRSAADPSASLPLSPGGSTAGGGALGRPRPTPGSPPGPRAAGGGGAGRPPLPGLTALQALVRPSGVAAAPGQTQQQQQSELRSRRGGGGGGWQFWPGAPFLSQPHRALQAHISSAGGAEGGSGDGPHGTWTGAGAGPGAGAGAAGAAGAGAAGAAGATGAGAGAAGAGTAAGNHDQRAAMVGRVVLSELPNAVHEVRSSFWSWAGPVLGVIYLISPLDLIPDFIPLLGWVDDMVVLTTVIWCIYCLATRQPQLIMVPPTTHGRHAT